MADAKHTPGPWSTAATDDTLVVRGRLKIADTFPVRWNPGLSDFEEQEANARLVAASPRLLAALKALVAIHDDEFGTMAPEMDEALAAVAEAEGTLAAITKVASQ